MLIYKIFAFVFLIPGVLLSVLAKTIVKKFKMDEKAKCDFENEMNEVEMKEYKFNKAVVNLKMIGVLLVIPGLLLIIFAFRK